MWFFFALYFAIWTSIASIITKRIVKGVDPGLVIFIGNIFTIPFAFVFLLFIGIPKVSDGFYLLLLQSSLLDVIAFLAAIWALRISPISLVSPVQAFNPIFATVIATFFLQEVPTPNKLLGIIVIVGGAYLLNIQDIKRGLLLPFIKLFSDRGVQLSLLASFIWGITPVFQKKAILLTSPVNPFFPSFVGIVFVGCLITPLIFKKIKDVPVAIKNNLIWFLILAIFSVAAGYAAFTAFSQTNVGYATAVFKLSTIFTVLWGALFFKEKRIKERLLGASVMLIGVVLLVL